MVTRVVYFTVNGRNEQAEFRTDEDAEEVEDLFRAAAEAEKQDILKLYNDKGNIVTISPRLVENTPDSRYHLHVVASQQPERYSTLEFDLSKIEERLQALETKIIVDKGIEPEGLGDLKKQVDEFKEKLESVEHLNALGLFRDMSSGSESQNRHNVPEEEAQKHAERHRSVLEKFTKMSRVQVTDQVRDDLKKPAFDNWQWEDPEMMVLLRQMYLDLNLVEKFNIEMPVLHSWLFEVYKHYNDVPFHNFKHCFMVAQMMYGLIWLIDLREKIEAEDILMLMTAAICHDLDHPGYSNQYQINARTALALRYNDISPLENHHSAVAFEILRKPHCNIFQNLPKDTFKIVREGMIRCILGTDMGKHNEILSTFNAILPTFDIQCKEHKSMLLMILLKTADISNEVRPPSVSEPWAHCLFEEYFIQGDLEKREGLPVAPHMDREKTTKPSSQIGFIKYVLLPMFESLGTLFPVIQDDIIQPVRDALQYYTHMQHVMEDGKVKKEADNNSSKSSADGKNGIRRDSQTSTGKQAP